MLEEKSEARENRKYIRKIEKPLNVAEARIQHGGLAQVTISKSPPTNKVVVSRDEFKELKGQMIK